MQRRHFEAMAKSVAESIAEIERTFAHGDMTQIERENQRRGCYAVANRLAYACREFNPNFDRERFLRACDVLG